MFTGWIRTNVISKQLRSALREAPPKGLATTIQLRANSKHKLESRTGFEPVSQRFAGVRLSHWTNETLNWWVW